MFTKSPTTKKPSPFYKILVGLIRVSFFFVKEEVITL